MPLEKPVQSVLKREVETPGAKNDGSTKNVAHSKDYYGDSVTISQNILMTKKSDRLILKLETNTNAHVGGRKKIAGMI